MIGKLECVSLKKVWKEEAAARKKAGKKGVTGSQITKCWKAEDRDAGCHSTIGDLVKAKKIKRQAIQGKKRGSLFRPDRWMGLRYSDLQPSAG